MIADILLLAATAPGAAGIGGTVLADLLALRPERQVHSMVVAPYGSPRHWLGQFALRLLRGHETRLARFRREALDRAVADAERADARTAWLVANSPEIIAVGRALVQRDHDVRLLVWDDPDYLLDNLRLGAAARRQVWDDFAALVTGARAVAVVSDGMAVRYRDRFGADAMVLRHAIDPARIQPRTPRDRSRPLRLVFAGSLYSKAEWNALVAALEHARWTLGDRLVELHFLGRFPRFGATRPARLVDHGFVPLARALNLMRDMDAGYLPYWFDAAKSVAARTSFPGKLTAYTEANLAIFNHSPVYTEVSAFLSRFSYGVSCPTLDRDEILAALGDLAARVDDPATADARAMAVAGPLSRHAAGLVLDRLLDPSLCEQAA